jgi:hypothetical protein
MSGECTVISIFGDSINKIKLCTGSSQYEDYFASEPLELYDPGLPERCLKTSVLVYIWDYLDCCSGLPRNVETRPTA